MPNVGELMTREPIRLEATASALAALDLMTDSGVRHLPIVDSRGRLCGVASIDDLRAALPFAVRLTRPASPAERELARDYVVAELMTHGPITATPQTSLDEAAGTLARFRIGCLPVVDGKGHLVGIFSETDALRALAARAAPAAGAPSGRVLDLELLVAELRAERERIARQLERTQATERELSSVGRETPTDREEQARALVDLATEEPLAGLAARRLAALDHALARAQRGALGRCEKCGRDIPIARLRALPGATECVRCAAGAAQ